MNSLIFIDVGLGLVLVYALLSLVCTAATELISSVVRMRGRTLEAGIRNLLQNQDLVNKVYEFPLVKCLYRGARKPSAISPQTFATALLHTISGGGLALAKVRSGLATLPEDSQARKSLEALISQAGGKIDKLHSLVTQWFDTTMERVTGWYKRWAQLITFIAAVLIVGLINADTVQFIARFSSDIPLRNAVVTRAVVVANQQSMPQASTAEDARDLVNGLKDIGIPLGWEAPPWAKPIDRDGNGRVSLREAWSGAVFPVLLKVLGLLITALAMTLGAPFWFDVLKRLAKVRSVSAEASGSSASKNP